MFRLPRLENWRDVLALCLVLMGLQQLVSAGFVQAKANLAQVLIERAWQQSLGDSYAPVRPWPWADTWPVARLAVPAHDTSLYVLAGSTGNALAFGPGYELASASPGSAGTTVIGGHRDTHFAFLRDVAPGTELTLEVGERALRYRVVEGRVMDPRSQPLQGSGQNTSELLLVTCYPFDALHSGGPLRYVVRARQLTGESTAGQRLSTDQPREIYQL